MKKVCLLLRCSTTHPDYEHQRHTDICRETWTIVHTKKKYQSKKNEETEIIELIDYVNNEVEVASEVSMGEDTLEALKPLKYS